MNGLRCSGIGFTAWSGFLGAFVEEFGELECNWCRTRRGADDQGVIWEKLMHSAFLTS